MVVKDIQIGDRRIAADTAPLIVAEMSGNHNRSLERALEIVDAAAETGCDALKIQTYTADTITIDCQREEFLIADEKSLWKGEYLYQLYEKAFTPWEWHAAIFDRCRERGLLCFSTPFDETAVDILESLNAPAYKIASFENTHLPLIRKAAATGKPLIISTGMATVAELDATVRTAREAGCRDLILLKCTSAYPSEPVDAHLCTIPHLSAMFGCAVGLSDHTAGIGVGVAATALGARLIEKHFTLARADGGVDAAFSLEPAELRTLVEETRRAHTALGAVHYGRSAGEEKSLRFRRSIFAVKDIRAGETFTPENVRIIRPGDGLPPADFDALIGCHAGTDIERGTPLAWDLVS